MGQTGRRGGDLHTCQMSDGPKPHVGGPVVPPGAVSVLIGGAPAARMGDIAHASVRPDVIVKESPLS